MADLRLQAVRMGPPGAGLDPADARLQLQIRNRLYCCGCVNGKERV